MHYDDRLATVLRQPAKGDAIARIQFRQLLDLLGTMPASAKGPQIEAAYERLDLLSRHIPVIDRAKMLREPMLRLRNPRLLAYLADAEPAVATAAIASADLREDEWLALIPALPIRARGILRHRRGLGAKVEARLEQLGVKDRALPPGEMTEQVSIATEFEAALELTGRAAANDADDEEESGIGALVRRIEQFRKTRQGEPSRSGTGPFPHADAPRLPLDDSEIFAAHEPLESFDFVTGPDGRIAWADAPVAPMAVGLLINSSAEEAPAKASDELARDFAQRQPIAGQSLTILGAPAICGEWQVDATPGFDEITGRFLGYRGRMRRPAEDQTMAREEEALMREADRMRQILHELRTPANAIQMSAEVIQQQLYGPTPHEYRALAASIAGDTARILAGFEELDRLVKLSAGAMELDEGESDLGDVVRSTVAQLKAHTDPRKSGFSATVQEAPLTVGIAKIEAQRLVWRLLGSLAGAAAPAEFLELDCFGEADHARLCVKLPAALAGREEAELFHAHAESHGQTLSAGMFGLGFTLRLARAEAEAAGGSLEHEADQLLLSIPLLTNPQAKISQG